MGQFAVKFLQKSKCKNDFYVVVTIFQDEHILDWSNLDPIEQDPHIHLMSI